MNKSDWTFALLILVLGGLFFLPGLGAVHLFDWDEINFAEISREMLMTGEYGRVYIDFQPFWEKPPFFIWLQVLAMKAFGVNEFAARLPNALCGILSLFLLYRIGKKLYDQQMGILWALAYFGSTLPHLYFRSGIIDPVFNLLIFLGLYGLIRSYWKKDQMANSLNASYGSWTYLLTGATALGLAILTKGPAALLIVGLCLIVYWIMARFRWYVSFFRLVIYGLFASLLTLAWFGWETWQNGPWFVQEFTKYQYRLFSTPDAGHQGFPGFHLVVLLIGCFPASIFALHSLLRNTWEKTAYQKDFSRWMKIMFWVVLILFSIVQSKIVHYSSLCYFPLTYLAALSMRAMLAEAPRFSRRLKITLAAIALLFILAIIALPILAKNLDHLIPYIQDPFAVANLEAQVHWSNWTMLPAFLLAIALGLFYYTYPKNQWRAFLLLYFGNALFIFGVLFFCIQNIEQYSQRAAIEFWKEKGQEDAYLTSFEYKSYAPLFYGKKQAPENPKSLDSDWLMKGEIDKPVYLVCKIHKAKKVAQMEGFKEIGRKNGFVFFLRKPTPH